MGVGVVMVMMLVIVMLILIGGCIYVKKMLHVTDPNTETSIDMKDASTAQEFLPFVDIDGFMINLGNHRYRAIIECSSVNYNLKTETERDAIEFSYQKFISSLSFPITFHIQTRLVDNTVVVRELEKDVEKIRLENPGVYKYAKAYLDSMRNFDVYIGNVKQKKKYIIVGYEDAYVLGDLNDVEKRELSRNQLKDRVSFIISQLSSMQIKSRCLNEGELIDLLYNSYHREDSKYDISEMLGLGAYTTLLVSGINKMKNISVSEKLDLELLRVQNMIKEEYLDYKLGYDEDVYKEASNIYNKVKDIRDLLGSPYENNESINIGKDKSILNNVEENKFDCLNKGTKNKSKECEKEGFDFNGEFCVRDSIEFTENKKTKHTNEECDLGFEDVFEQEKKDEILDFEVDRKDSEWSLDFEDVFEQEKKDEILDFEADRKDSEWSLDFEDVFEQEKKDEILDFEADRKDSEWSLDFEDVFEQEKKDEILSFEEEKMKKNIRLTMFD